jgi:hypothetical protein
LCFRHASRILDAVQVEAIPAVIRDERVDDEDVRSDVHELTREIAADEPEAAGDHHAPAAIEVEMRRIHARSPWRGMSARLRSSSFVEVSP